MAVPCSLARLPAVCVHVGLLALLLAGVAGCAPRGTDGGMAQALPSPEFDEPVAAPTPAVGEDGDAPRAPLAWPDGADPTAEGEVRFQGYAGAAFGVDAAMLRRAWGGRLHGPDTEVGDACHQLVPDGPSDTLPRLAFMVERGHFVRLDVRTPDIVAPGGARVGMTVNQLRTLYGPSLGETPHKYAADWRMLRIRDPAGSRAALVLEVAGDGLVLAWRVGLPPQVDYVEGCS